MARYDEEVWRLEYARRQAGPPFREHHQQWIRGRAQEERRIDGLLPRPTS